ncbi:MAG: DUF362 domain-containing protein [Clostridia bacterium]|nr:DUF362 domain-containing protein [Clostridia bacterium]
MSPLVTVKHGFEPHLMAYQALEEVFEDEAKGKKILLKPNAGRIGPRNSALCTNAEVLRGLIRFFKDKGAGEIFVGDGALTGIDVWKAFQWAGITEVCEEEGVTLVNLDECDPVDIAIPDGIMVDKLRFSSLVFETDLVVSVPVIKTHMYTGVTLSIKNMKGCLLKREKMILHRIDKPCPDQNKGRCLDWGIADMASVLLPHYAVLDGTFCMEGFGPSAGTPKNLNLVVASKDSIAADFVGVMLMGMPWDSIAHLNLVRERCGGPTLDEIQVIPEDYMKYSQKFIPADLATLPNIYPNIGLIEKGTCSACSAAVMMFLKAHGHRFPQDFRFTLATGRDLSFEEAAREDVFLIGNCTAQKARGKGFCKGCPPVGSAILAFIKGEE